METSEIQKQIDEFEKNIGIEEYLLKYPIDMLLEFNNKNIKEKLKENSIKLYEFEKLYLENQIKFLKLQDLHHEIVSEQFDWYKFEYDRSLTTDEIKEFYIHKDPKVKQIKRLLDKQTIRKNFFKLCIKSFINQGRLMHDYVKVLEIEK